MVQTRLAHHEHSFRDTRCVERSMSMCCQLSSRSAVSQNQHNLHPIPLLTVGIPSLLLLMLVSWIATPENSDFSLQNCPYGVFSPIGSTDCRCCTIVGDTIIDLSVLEEASLFDEIAPPGIFLDNVLNPFLECRPTIWRGVRNKILDLLKKDGSDTQLRNNPNLQQAAFHSIDTVKLHLPIIVGDYTDFYSSREHATNVGIMFRGKDNALQPNWLHLPVGYHGRSSTIQVSGCPVTRPWGQLQKNSDDPREGSVHGPSKLLDFELEMAAVVGGPPNKGSMDISQAKERVFGYMLMNDWSARDIQKWEYVPLGPFTSKNFATTVSPWIVPADSLEAFRAPTSAGIQKDPAPLDYLQDPDYSSYDIRLMVAIRPEAAATPHVVSRSNLRHLYWSPSQQLAHHTVTGCVMKAGDLLGSGTISGTESTSFGSMLELSWKGTRDVAVGDETRRFLQDGDEVIMRAYCGKEGCGRVGFGECRAQVMSSSTGSTDATEESPENDNRYGSCRLYGFYNSSSTWRVRMVLEFKAIPCEMMQINLAKRENKSKEYLNINATGQVPVLECFDTEERKLIRITQSVAIIDFLEDAFPGKRSVYPRNLVQKARVQELVEVVNAGIQPLQNLFYLERLEKETGGTLNAQSQARKNVESGLHTLEHLVKRNQNDFLGPCCAGSFTPTVADFFVLPQLANARRLEIDVDAAFPALANIESSMKQTNWYIMSSPAEQSGVNP